MGHHPCDSLMRAMGLAGVSKAYYCQIHGSCSEAYPFGRHVFAGMEELLFRYHHAYKFHGMPLQLWVFYQSDVPYTRAQMSVRAGTYPSDSCIGRYYPAMGYVHGEHVICACLGKLWLDMPPWWVHRSRIASAAPPPEPEEPPPPTTPPSTPPPPCLEPERRPPEPEPEDPPPHCTDLDAMD